MSSPKSWRKSDPPIQSRDCRKSEPAMSPTQSSNRGRRFLLWSFGIIVILSLILGYAVTRLVRIDRNTSQLRDQFVQSVDLPVRSRVQLNLGPAALLPARFFIRFVKEIPPEARLALSAARRASVGIYSIDTDGREVDQKALFDLATEKMDARDWNLAVSVRDGNDTVMVYLPRKWSLDDEVNVWVAVCDGSQLVLVSAGLRMEPLMKLAAMHLPEDIFGG